MTAPAPGKRIPLWLFLGVGLFCTWANYGELSTIDSRVMLDAARSLSVGRGFTVHATLGVEGIDGRHYSKYGPANSLLMVPGVLVVRCVAPVLGERVPRKAMEECCASLLGAWLKAAVVLLVFLILRPLRPRAAVGSNVGLALLSLLMGFDFQYSRSYFPELPAALCLLLGVHLLATEPRGKPYRALALGAILAVGIGFRLDFLIFVPVFAWAAHRTACAADRRGWVQLGLPILAVLASIGALNHAAFGAPWVTGYRSESFSTASAEGWLGLIVSPGEGLLWFAPWLVLVPVFMVRATAQDPGPPRRLTGFVGALLLVAWLVFGGWHSWVGGQSWGPRFFVPLVPLLCLVYVAGRPSAGATRRLGTLLVAACALMNVLLLAAPYERFRAFGEVEGWTERERIWSPGASPWVHQPRMAVQALRGVARIDELRATARRRLEGRTATGQREYIGPRRALEESVSLNLPALWWLKLCVVGLPLAVSLGLGLALLLATGVVFHRLKAACDAAATRGSPCA